MLGTLYVVLSSSKEEDYQKVKKELLEIYPDFSVSPYKESQMEKDAVEFFATCQITKEKAKEVLDQLKIVFQNEKTQNIQHVESNKIGLKSVQRIVQMHHGEIFIQDQGFYTVIIVLPAL